MLEFKKIVYDLKDKMDKIFAPRISKDSVPSQAPTNSKDQFVIYKNGTTYRLYIFMDGTWYYANLTKS